MPAQRFQPASFAWHLFLIAVACTGVRCASAQTDVLEPGAAHAAAYAPAAAAYAERIAAAAGHAEALLRVAHDAQQDAALSAPARERVLYLSVMALAATDVNASAAAATHELLATLAARPASVEVWQYDGPARVAVPLYDVAAAAHYAQRHQVERQAHSQALAGIARGSDAPLALYDAAAGRPAEQRAILQAFEQADDTALLAYRDRLDLAVANGEQVAVTAIVARRLADAALMRAALVQADAATALAMVRGVRASFPVGDALDLLQAATARADVASAALLEIGRMAASAPRARTLLFAALADGDAAGSAAAALASAHDPDIAAALREWVRDEPDLHRARRGVLALRLDASEAARAALADLAADPRLAPQLRHQAAQ